MSISHLIFLIAALSLDAFAVSIAYGTSKISIPFGSIIVINIICSAMLFVSLYLGMFLRDFLIKPEIFASLILFGLGFIKTFDSLIKNYIRKNQGHKKMTFKLFDINFILDIYANPKKADIDKSRSISPKESLSLAVALGLDNLAAGIGAGLIFNPFLAVGISLLTGTLAIMFGLSLGKKISKNGRDFSMVSGIMLMILAMIK